LRGCADPGVLPSGVLAASSLAECEPILISAKPGMAS
jgi:hypothetical protein